MTRRASKFIPMFWSLYRHQRDKVHGAEKAPRVQAALFAWVGAHLASGLGPNPYRVMWTFRR